MAVENQPITMYVGIKAVICRPGTDGGREFLLLKGKSKSVAGGWRWDLPGGRINVGEYRAKVTLQRELQEELNLTSEELEGMKLGKCFGLQVVPRPTLKNELALCFYEVEFIDEQIRGKDFRLSEEHISWEWHKWSELGKLRNSDGEKTDWAQFLIEVSKS